MREVVTLRVKWTRYLFFHPTLTTLNRVSIQEAADTINETVGPFLQVGGYFVLVSGFWIFMFEYTEGVPLRLNDLGPIVLVSGLFSVVVGTLMIWMSSDDVRREEQLRLLSPQTERLPKRTLPRLSQSPKSSFCPKCGYENRKDGFFCTACNSPLWPKGTPTGVPPERSIVERRIRRTIAFRSARRVLLFVVLAIAVSTPFAVGLAAAYMAVNNSTLTIYQVQFDPYSSPVNQTMTIEWHLDSQPWGNEVYLTSPTFRLVASNLELKPYPGCSNNAPGTWGRYTVFLCVLGVPDVNETQLIGSTLTLTVSATAHFYAYQQQITRSASTTISG